MCQEEPFPGFENSKFYLDYSQTNATIAASTLFAILSSYANTHRLTMIFLGVIPMGLVPSDETSVGGRKKYSAGSRKAWFFRRFVIEFHMEFARCMLAYGKGKHVVYWPIMCNPWWVQHTQNFENQVPTKGMYDKIMKIAGRIIDTNLTFSERRTWCDPFDRQHFCLPAGRGIDGKGIVREPERKKKKKRIPERKVDQKVEGVQGDIAVVGSSSGQGGSVSSETPPGDELWTGSV